MSETDFRMFVHELEAELSPAELEELAAARERARRERGDDEAPVIA